LHQVSGFNEIISTREKDGQTKSNPSTDQSWTWVKLIEPDPTRPNTNIILLGLLCSQADVISSQSQYAHLPSWREIALWLGWAELTDMHTSIRDIRGRIGNCTFCFINPVVLQQQLGQPSPCIGSTLIRCQLFGLRTSLMAIWVAQVRKQIKPQFFVPRCLTHCHQQITIIYARFDLTYKAISRIKAWKYANR